MKKQTIGLFGLFGVDNFGNDASLETILLFLRRARPDANLVCICEGPKRVLTDYHIAAIPINWIRSDNYLFRNFNRLLLKIPGRLVDLFYTFRAVKQFDVIIVPGTGILDDFNQSPWTLPYALLKWCLAARVHNIKFGFVSVGAGPMDNLVNRWLLKSAARLASYRSYRDKISKEFMESIGLDTRNDPVYPDIVFKLPMPASPARLLQDADVLTVGVGVMQYHGPRGRDDDGKQFYDTYLKNITRFVLWLLDHGHRVRLFVGDALDQHAVDFILNAVAAERGHLSHEQLSGAPIKTFHDLMREIGHTDIVVANRFHNLIFALKLCKPTISLGYRKRHGELMNEMGLGAFSQPLENLDVDRLIDQFTRLTSTRKNYIDTIGKTNVAYEKLLSQQEDLLAESLLSP